MPIGRSIQQVQLPKLLKTAVDLLLLPAMPFNLAIDIVLVFYQIVASARHAPVDVVLELRLVFREYPPGWGCAKPLLPLFEPPFAHGMQLVCTASALLACAGLATRIAATIVAGSAVYLLGLSHFFFKINHADHPLIWCALIIAFSPSGTALSLDSLIRTWNKGAPCLSLPSEPTVAYALPLRLCGLSFGVAYFFPGFYKAVQAGDLWISGAAINYQ